MQLKILNLRKEKLLKKERLLASIALKGGKQNKNVDCRLKMIFKPVYFIAAPGGKWAIIKQYTTAGW